VNDCEIFEVLGSTLLCGNPGDMRLLELDFLSAIKLESILRDVIGRIGCNKFI
jgi:hypothetical protein